MSAHRTLPCPHCNEPIGLRFFDFSRIFHFSFLTCPSCGEKAAFPPGVVLSSFLGSILCTGFVSFLSKPYLNWQRWDAGDSSAIFEKLLTFLVVCATIWLSSAYICRGLARRLVKFRSWR